MSCSCSHTEVLGRVPQRGHLACHRCPPASSVPVASLPGPPGGGGGSRGLVNTSGSLIPAAGVRRGTGMARASLAHFPPETQDPCQASFWTIFARPSPCETSDQLSVIHLFLSPRHRVPAGARPWHRRFPRTAGTGLHPGPVPLPFAGWDPHLRGAPSRRARAQVPRNPAPPQPAPARRLDKDSCFSCSETLGKRWWWARGQLPVPKRCPRGRCR